MRKKPKTAGPSHREKLLDVGTTTALAAMVEVAERRDDGVLARQALAMLDRFGRHASDRRILLEGFLNEIQASFESHLSKTGQK